MDPNALRQSPLLSNLAVRYQNKGYIAEQIFKTVEVPAEAGVYPVYDDDVTFRVHDTDMAYLASANYIDLKASLATFNLKDHALKTYIDPKEIKQAGAMPVRATKVDMLMNAMKLALEVEVATLLANSAVFTTGATLSGTDQWTDYSGSDPRAAILELNRNALVPFNTLVLSRYGYNKLLLHTKIQSAIQYVQKAYDVASILAGYLGVEQILIGDAKKSTNKKGQTQALTDVWGKDATLMYIAPGQPSALMDKPSVGYMPVSNGGGGMWRVYTGRNPEMGTAEGAEMIKVESTYKPLVSAPRLAYRLTAAFA